MVVRLHGMLLLSAKCPRPLGRWENAIRKTIWSVFTKRSDEASLRFFQARLSFPLALLHRANARTSQRLPTGLVVAAPNVWAEIGTNHPSMMGFIMLLRPAISAYLHWISSSSLPPPPLDSRVPTTPLETRTTPLPAFALWTV